MQYVNAAPREGVMGSAESRARDPAQSKLLRGGVNNFMNSESSARLVAPAHH